MSDWRDSDPRLQNVRDLVLELKEKADQAEWDGHPNAYRLRYEYQLVKDAYDNGTTHIPRF